MTRRVRSTPAIFAIPAAIGVAAILGLILGLTGDGLRDGFAWLLVGAAPLIIIAALLRRPSGAKPG